MLSCLTRENLAAKRGSSAGLNPEKFFGFFFVRAAKTVFGIFFLVEARLSCIIPDNSNKDMPLRPAGLSARW
jgi:hypothetical protein